MVHYELMIAAVDFVLVLLGIGNALHRLEMDNKLRSSGRARDSQ